MYSHASVYCIYLHRDTFLVFRYFSIPRKTWKNLVLTLLFTISTNGSTEAELDTCIENLLTPVKSFLQDFLFFFGIKANNLEKPFTLL